MSLPAQSQPPVRLRSAYGASAQDRDENDSMPHSPPRSRAGRDEKGSITLSQTHALFAVAAFSAITAYHINGEMEDLEKKLEATDATLAALQARADRQEHVSDDHESRLVVAHTRASSTETGLSGVQDWVVHNGSRIEQGLSTVRSKVDALKGQAAQLDKRAEALETVVGVSTPSDDRNVVPHLRGGRK